MGIATQIMDWDKFLSGCPRPFGLVVSNCIQNPLALEAGDLMPRAEKNRGRKPAVWPAITS